MAGDQTPQPAGEDSARSSRAYRDLTGLGSLGSSGAARDEMAATVSPAGGGSTVGRALRAPVGGTPGSRVWVFFGTDGRIGRATFWLGLLLLYLGLGACAVLAGLIAAMLRAPIAGIVLLLPILIGFFWGSIGLHVKRWHDRDKSGWWMFIVIVPFVGFWWSLIETGFLSGTAGPNRYGTSAIRVFGR